VFSVLVLLDSGSRKTMLTFEILRNSTSYRSSQYTHTLGDSFKTTPRTIERNGGVKVIIVHTRAMATAIPIRFAKRLHVALKRLLTSSDSHPINLPYHSHRRS
jgi:hypothetical protein